MKNIVSNFHKKLMDHKREINAKQQSLFIYIYQSEINTSPDIDQENTCYFQELIGILHWYIELSLDNVAVEVYI